MFQINSYFTPSTDESLLLCNPRAMPRDLCCSGDATSIKTIAWCKRDLSLSLLKQIAEVATRSGVHLIKEAVAGPLMSQEHNNLLVALQLDEAAEAEKEKVTD